MSPQTRAKLLRVAHADGYDHFGDWLATVAHEKLKEMEPRKRKKGVSGPQFTFALRVRETTALLNSLFRSFDRDTKVANSAEIQHRLTLLDDSHRRLFGFLHSQGLRV